MNAVRLRVQELLSAARTQLVAPGAVRSTAKLARLAGLDPGRALTNAQPTTKELNDGRAEQFACIRQRMVEQAEDPITAPRPGST